MVSDGWLGVECEILSHDLYFVIMICIFLLGLIYYWIILYVMVLSIVIPVDICNLLFLMSLFIPIQLIPHLLLSLFMSPSTKHFPLHYQTSKCIL